MNWTQTRQTDGGKAGQTDEPTSGLDPISTGKVEAALQSLKQEYTIILVPHSVQQAGRAADYAAFFLQGELIEYGERKSLFTAPKEKRTEDIHHGQVRVERCLVIVRAVFFCLKEPSIQ